MKRIALVGLVLLLSGAVPVQLPGSSITQADAITISGSLSSSQILNLGTTPITLVAASSGNVLQVVSDMFEMLAGATPYSTAGSMIIQYQNGAGTTAASLCNATFIQAAANRTCSMNIPTFNAVSTGIVGQPLVLNSTGAITAGNGTMVYQITYRIVYGF